MFPQDAVLHLERKDDELKQNVAMMRSEGELGCVCAPQSQALRWDASVPHSPKHLGGMRLCPTVSST